MSRAAIQAGLFTLGVPPEKYDLPHPRLALPVILLIRRILLRAFEMLRERDYPLATAKEDEITSALNAIVENDLRQSGSVNGFHRSTYEKVVRGAEVVNYDMTKPKKEPDLCFKLRNNEEEPRPVLSEHDALFVECKPIDKTHAAGSRYCDDGLIRFVDGDYAWAMQEGMMLGYARHGRTIAGHLIPAMRQPARMDRLKTAEPPRPVASRGGAGRSNAETLHVSRHRRGFPWPENKGPATDILIYHSWHACV